MTLHGFRSALRLASSCLATLVVLASAAPVAAAPGDGQAADSSSQRPRSSTPDFLLQRPYGSIGVRGSWVFARAGSDLFDFVTDQLTIEKGDFNAPALAVDLGIALNPRIEAVAGFEYSRASASSEYRAYVDNNGLPINQQSELQGINLSGSVKVALMPRGREVSRFAWVPQRVSPYVGAGGGVLWYKFEQTGDFVDFVDLSVFGDVFRSTGWAPSAHVFGGADLQIHKRLYFTVEGRYLWASGELSSDFIDFDPIDLAGFRLAAGINVLF